MKSAALIVIALALAATTAFGEQWRDIDVDGLMENAPAEDAYPDAAALFLNIQEMTVAAEDGSLVTTRNRLTNLSNRISLRRLTKLSMRSIRDRTSISPKSSEMFFCRYCSILKWPLKVISLILSQ